jgi:glycerol-3-phosphate dehydrogenase
MHGLDGIAVEEADAALVGFLRERWKGMWPILYGDQLRQVRLDDWIFQGVLDVEHLPPPPGLALRAQPPGGGTPWA